MHRRRKLSWIRSQSLLRNSLETITSWKEGREENMKDLEETDGSIQPFNNKKDI